MEELFQHLIELSPIWIYLFIGGIAYIENIFPPFPSDFFVVAAGYLVAIGRIDFFIMLILTSLASTSGFLSMYKIGNWFGIKVVEERKLKFISLSKIHKVEEWFNIYGYGIIIANRFLAGTRAVVSFFAGMSQLSLMKTTLLSFLSAAAWNFILLYSGKKLGENWRIIAEYLKTYGMIISFVIIICIISYFIYASHYRRNKSSDNEIK